MITYSCDNIFNSPAQVLVNPVNTVGVMGKGLALTFKQIYPEMYREYRELCESGKLKIGQLHLYPGVYKDVLNFPTKEHWANPSRLEYVESGLEFFVSVYESWGIQSISFPMLGCGNGGLDWESEVRPLMERYLSELPIDIIIHVNNFNWRIKHASRRKTN